jgi:aryl-alcohol dehydrogenase-like predicted oxidoreductase
VISAFVATVVLWEVPRRATPCSTGTAGQVALAWLLAQPYDIAPIPGSKRVAYVRENLGATATPLSVDDVALLADLFDPALRTCVCVRNFC